VFVACGAMIDPVPRWLRSLGCPFANVAKPSRPLDMQRAVNWLEDTHIRALPPASRAALRTSSFPDAVDSYLRALSAPAEISWEDDCTSVLRWLTRRALLHATEDDADALAEPDDPWKGRPFPVVDSAAESDAVVTAVRDMAKAVGFDDTIRERCCAKSDEIARAVADFVEGRMRDKGATDPGDSMECNLDDLTLGFATGDEATDRVARVIRLLYVKELRALQDRSNEALATMQGVTANPRTDSRLGQVGR
jgi:RNA transcription, translation and transport factor protein